MRRLGRLERRMLMTGWGGSWREGWRGGWSEETAKVYAYHYYN